ncbi:Tkl protein kinase, partial [Globisporangium polare]
MRPRAALATALLVVLATATPAAWAVKSKGDCTDATFANAYSGIREQMDACEEASGQVMQVPMKKKLKVIFCTKCPELLALKNSGTLPACNVTTTTGAEIHLQSAFNRMFSECDGGTATSNSDGSDDDGGSTEPTTTTSAPSATTKTPVTTKPPAATDTGSKSSSSPSQSSASTSGDTAAVSSSTPKPPPTDSSTTSQTASASGGSSSLGIGAIVGIIAGVLAVIVLAAFFVIRSRRDRNGSCTGGSDKDDYDISVLQAPTTGHSSTAPYQFSFITNSTGDSK